jgi:hypothetical protein
MSLSFGLPPLPAVTQRKSQDCRETSFVLGGRVPLQEHVKFEPQGKGIRGTSRLNSRVPIAIESTESGQLVRAEGFTKDISTRGCMAIVPQAFALGEKVRVINLVNQNSCEAVLIWRGHQAPAGWELGLELQERLPDFWGLDF